MTQYFEKGSKKYFDTDKDYKPGERKTKKQNDPRDFEMETGRYSKTKVKVKITEYDVKS